tara:strand:+ start:164 stop:499 length:336 start_codon:yes stop_codon:yes gene_type:complete
MLKQRIRLKWYVDCPLCGEEIPVPHGPAYTDFPVVPEKCYFCKSEFLLYWDLKQNEYTCYHEKDAPNYPFKRGKVEKLVIDNLSDLQISLIYDTIKSKKSLLQKEKHRQIF